MLTILEHFLFWTDGLASADATFFELSCYAFGNSDFQALSNVWPSITALHQQKGTDLVHRGHLHIGPAFFCARARPPQRFQL